MTKLLTMVSYRSAEILCQKCLFFKTNPAFEIALRLNEAFEYSRHFYQKKSSV